MKRLVYIACLAFAGNALANTCTIRQAGATDQTVYVTLLDATTGVPTAGLAFNTAGIDLEYVRTGATAVDITEATQTTNGAHSDGGFVSVGHGRYRLDLPDAAVAASVPEVVIQGVITGYVLAPCSVALSPSVNLASANSASIDNADFATAPGASGGLLISGSNTGTTTLGALTITGATTHTGNVVMSAGLNVTQSSSNTPALVVTGNGTGNGATFTSGSGATGTGIAVVSAATNGTALTLAGVGTGNGLTATGGATGHGISGVGGATSGNGIRATGTAGNSVALNLIGQGSAAGLLSTGGATGHGISAVGGATSGDGIRAVGTAGNSNALNLIGQGSANGLLATGGATGHGISAVGGATSGNGLRAAGTAGNSDAMNLVGQGSANGLLSTGGATGHGMRLVGGATSGNGISTAFTAPTGSAVEWGWKSGTLSGTHSTTTADLGTNAPGTVSDVVGMTLYFPTRDLARGVTSYDTATGIATFATIDADITLTNADPWILWGTAPSSGAGGGATAAEVADAVWDEDMTAHQTQGSAGQVIGDSVSDSDSIWAKANFLPSAVAGATGGVFIAGTNAATTVTTALTTTFTGNLTGSVGSVTGAVGSVTGAVGSVTGAVGSVTGNVGGNVTGSVGTVNALAANSITAAATAADFSTEVNSGMSTQASVDDIPTNAELATALGTADDAVLARLPAALVSGRIDASVGAMAANTITAAATASDFGTEVAVAMRDTVVEDQGTISLGCALAAILGYTSGDIATSGANSTYEESTGAETRITINVSSPGNRTSTITCPTY